MFSRSVFSRICSVASSRGVSTTTKGSTSSATKLSIPPRPLSQYQLFCSEKLKSGLVRNPGTKSTEAIKRCGQEWRSLSEEAKEIYKRRAMDALKKYQTAIEAMTPQQKRVLSQMKKERRVIRPAAAPKRPLSSFLRFCAKNRHVVKQTTTDVKAQARKLAEMWKNAATNEKTALEQEFKRDYAFYKSALQDYQNRVGKTRKLTFGALKKQKERALEKAKEAKLKERQKAQKEKLAYKKKLAQEKLKKKATLLKEKKKAAALKKKATAPKKKVTLVKKKKATAVSLKKKTSTKSTKKTLARK